MDRDVDNGRPIIKPRTRPRDLLDGLLAQCDDSAGTPDTVTVHGPSLPVKSASGSVPSVPGVVVPALQSTIVASITKFSSD